MRCDRRERLQLLDTDDVDAAASGVDHQASHSALDASLGAGAVPFPHVDNELDRPMIIEASINGDGLGLSQWWM